MRRTVRLGFMLPSLVLGACELAPVYQTPSVDLSTRFKEDGVWRIAQPSDRLPRGPWWTTYEDRTLDDLESQVDTSNETLNAAFANEQQARADVLQAESGLLPTVGLDSQLTTNRQSDNRPLRSADQPNHYGDNDLGIQSSYEIDLWGRVHDTIASSAAEAQAQADLFESVRLSLHADVARTYVALRGLDCEIKLLRDTSRAYKDALTLTQTRVAGKIASPIDEARAQSQLESAKALIDDAIARRSVLEHAIATLVGRPASSFSIPINPIVVRIPRGPAAVPSTLLERRPDVAAAEREVAAANDQIGVAKAAFYPRVFLNLSGGTQDTGLHLLDLNNELFSLGPSVSLPIFDGGRRTAALTATLARRDETVARYRGTVLQAVQDVEDALSQDHNLRLESQQLNVTVAAEKKVMDLSLTLYRDGATTYLDVVTAQTALLDQQRVSLTLATRRLTTSIDLFVALGGGWTAESLVASDSPI